MLQSQPSFRTRVACDSYRLLTSLSTFILDTTFNNHTYNNSTWIISSSSSKHIHTYLEVLSVPESRDGMSSSMPIPKRRHAGESSYSSSSSSSYSSPVSGSSLSTPSSSKGKAPLSESPQERISPRRPSLLGRLIARLLYPVACSSMTTTWLCEFQDTLSNTYDCVGSSLSKSEHTVVNLGHEDGPPRLVSLERNVIKIAVAICADIPPRSPA